MPDVPYSVKISEIGSKLWHLTSDNIMLLTTLATQPDLFETLAQSWMAAGASSFSVWNGTRILAYWPDSMSPGTSDLVAPIQVGGAKLGEVRVVGLTGAAIQARLSADAAFIARVIGLEDELGLAIAELTNCQDQLLAFYNLTQSTRSQLQIEESLRSLMREVSRLVKAESAFTVLSASVGSSALVQYPVALLDKEESSGFFQRMQACGYEMLVHAEDDPGALPPGIMNLCFVPIQIRGAIIAGGLGVVNKPGEGFTAPDMKLVRAIANQAGALIEKVLLYREAIAQTRLQTEMKLAWEVQVRLLPQHPPVVEGLDVFARSRPASHVGGDFYDFIAQPGRPFIFMVGDVTGKGISAALLMTMTRTAIRSKATFMPKPSPVTLMNRSNEDLYDDFTEVGMFVTVFVGQYEPAHRHILYTNAGHSPVIYCPHGGSAHMLEATGTPMGMLPVSLCEQQTVAFGPGDVLVVATDGFSEARALDEQLFGYDRLLDLVETHAGRSADEIASALFAAVEHFSGGRPRDDDQTLLVIKGV